MAQIPRIEDTYIDSIIKSAGAYQPSLSKTQGVKLRELIKLFRDRFEQEITTSTNNYYNKSETDGRYLPLQGTADNSTSWAGMNYSGTDVPINTYIMAYGTDSKWHPVAVDKVKSFLSLGSSAHLNAFEPAEPNSVVQRNGSGDITSRLFKMNTGVGDNPVFKFLTMRDDGYIVNSSTAQMQSVLGIQMGGETLQSVRNRDSSIYSTDNSSSSYIAAAFQIRETSKGGSSSFLPPRMAFHWSGVVASQIALEANGRIAILNNPGTAYEGLNVGAILSDGGITVSAGYNYGFGLEDGFSIVRRAGYTGFNYGNMEKMAITPTGIVVQGEGYFSNGILQVNNLDTAIPTLGAAGGSFRMTSHAVYGLYAGVQSSGDVFMQVQRNDGDPAVYNLKLQPNGGNINIGSSSSAVSKLNIERSVAGNFKGISITNGDVNNGSGTSINMGFQAGTTNPYGIRLVQSGNPTQTKSGSFDIQSSTGNTDDTWTSRLLINASGKVYIGTTDGEEQLNVGGWINTVGNYGWFNGTYQGGIHMTDSTWVRVYNTKAFLVDNQVRANGFVNAEAGFGFKSDNFRGMVGNYDNQGTSEMMIWTIGDQWNEIETHHGIGYQYYSKYGTNHQIVFKNAGVTHASINLENGNANFDGTVYASSGFGTDVYNTISALAGSPMTYVGYHGHSFRTLNNSQIAQIGNGSNSLDSIFNGSITAPTIKVDNQLIIPTSRPSSPERGSIWIE